MDIDALGSYNTVKATIEHLCASASRNPNPSPDGRTGGRILFVSATFHYTGMPLQAHVSAAKAAVDALSASVAIEYGPRGVTSNVVAPGAIEGTEGMERLSVALAPDSRQSVRDVPSQRWGRVREIADATVFLFSDAGNYVNGAVLVVDGAGWRRHGSLGVGLDPGMTYPDFLLTEANSKIIKSGEKPRAATRTAAKL